MELGSHIRRQGPLLRREQMLRAEGTPQSLFWTLKLHSSVTQQQLSSPSSSFYQTLKGSNGPETALGEVC